MNKIQGVRLSTRERDRRYHELREEMAARNVGAVIATGTNMLYLTDGLPGERFAVLPAGEAPLTAFINARHLVDIPSEALLEDSEWVQLVRPAAEISPVADLLRELGLERGLVGYDAGLSHLAFVQLKRALPDCELVNVSDMFANVRALKSEEELAMIEQAGRVFEAAIHAVHAFAKPGMLGATIVQEGIRAMWAAGGDMNSSFQIGFGPTPKQNPALAELCLKRRVAPGDMLTLTAHSEYGSYAGHSDQEISMGMPSQLHHEMFQAVLEVRHEVLKHVRPGVRHSELVSAYRKAVARTPFRPSPHAQIHQFGIDVPESPGPRFHVRDAGNAAPGRGRADFTLQAGMVYSISPTLVAPEGDDTILGGTSLVVTDTGYRDLETRRVELMIISV